MLILALDTSLASCSVALWRDGRILARRAKPMERGHSEALMPMIAETLGNAATTARCKGTSSASATCVVAT